MNLIDVHYLVSDVDGVLTPGSVLLDDNTVRLMHFDIHDGSAIKRWLNAGHGLALLSGRRTEAVKLRAVELGITTVRQGVADKREGLEQLLAEQHVAPSGVCYIGDDLPDLPAMEACGFAVAVANAVPELKRVAHYVTRRRGGSGAVAEVIELLLRKQRLATVASHKS